MKRDSRVGIILNNLTSSQIAYFAIKEANLYTDLDISIFYENMALPFIDLKVPMMSVSELWSYNGTVIATSIDTAIMLNKIISNINRVFYVNDIEWIRDKTNFLYNVQAFDKDIKVFARSNEHAKIIEAYGNVRVVDILPIFNLKKIMGAIC